MDEFHYWVAIAGYVGAGVALLVAVYSSFAWQYWPPTGDVVARLVKASVTALVLALLSSILMRMIGA